MADKATVSTPPADEDPASSVSTPAQPAAAPAKKDAAWLRYLRYMYSFVDGTINDSLDSFSNWGNRGLKWGAGIGFLALIAGVSGGFSLVILGAAAGLLAGAVGGGVAGAVTGGVRGSIIENRKDKYADDLIERAKAKAAPLPQSDYRSDYQDYRQKNYWKFDRIEQQNREHVQDNHRHFRDRVEHSREHHHHSHDQGL